MLLEIAGGLMVALWTLIFVLSVADLLRKE